MRHNYTTIVGLHFFDSQGLRNMTVEICRLDASGRDTAFAVVNIVAGDIVRTLTSYELICRRRVVNRLALHHYNTKILHALKRKSL